MVMGEFTQDTELLVIGGGPGGYAAAFRAADLGMDVTMVDPAGRPGGVCLFRGCIPSKTLLHVAELLRDARQAKEMGISFSEPEIRLESLRDWKNRVIEKLASGLAVVSKRRGVQVLQGRASFESSQMVRIVGGEVSHVRFKHAVIATGSRAAGLPGHPFRKGSRVMGSTAALELGEIPQRLLVIGGGYVGMELGSVYASLGSRVTVVEWNERIMMGADGDLVQVLSSNLRELFQGIHLRTRVVSLEETERSVEVAFEGNIDPLEQSFDRVLVAVGRLPNTSDLGIEKTGVALDSRGFIRVDERMRTADEKIYAVGDVAGGVMLAHKAMHEGKIAVEVIAGRPSAFDFRAVPAVVYTDPQVAWCGLTEEEARRTGRPVRVSRFPWSASGRAVSLGFLKGMTKILFDPETQRVLGMGIVGREAGEMISEGVLAVEMGALAEDLAMSIHPHPTLSEGEEEAAGAFLGSSTHILPLKS
ncbi:MAG TPA: dihydrolipoyl dehydrogenase [Syntrophobacteraceae bacterium]|nr:dihydrolipoyl dehydrogenase [Syntrophobacteraceae bacterium]